jgi:pantothenate kinase
VDHRVNVDPVAVARELAARPGRTLLGICGAPGSGKSTLAERLHAAVPGSVLVGMDGFHLAQEQLRRDGSTDRKGAPDTFDAHGYVALLERLRRRDEPVVFAPRFHRDIEEPIACAVPVPEAAKLVITEGNYLLLESEPWARIPELLDETWFLAPPEQLRIDRLIARHERYGRSHEQARGRALGSDQRNADLVAVTGHRATRHIAVD